MAGSHQPQRAATTDLPNQINNVCMYVNEFSPSRNKSYTKFKDKTTLIGSQGGSYKRKHPYTNQCTE